MLEARSLELNHTCHADLVHVCTASRDFDSCNSHSHLHLLYLFIVRGVCAFSFCDAVVGHDYHHLTDCDVGVFGDWLGCLDRIAGCKCFARSKLSVQSCIKHVALV